MSEPNSDLQSKINRAIRAVLIDRGAVNEDNCFADPESADRILPNSTISTGEGNPFDGPGNWQFPEILINIRDEATVQPNMASEDPRLAANVRATAIWNALNRSDDETTLYFTASEITRLGRALAVAMDSSPAAVAFAAANADMAEFTCLWWEAAAQGPAKKHEDGTFWSRDFVFSCVACNGTLAA